MANILIVDDSTFMRKKISAILTAAGHTVVGEAETGQQAYNQYAKLKPDIVTMDITMPNVEGIEMDGIAAVKKIINAFPDAQIIMLSGVGQKAMVLEAIQNGAKNYIVKPLEEDKFLQVVSKVFAEAKFADKRNDTAVKKQNVAPETKQENINVNTDKPAFSIENVNGVFIISINKSVNENTHFFLDTAVQGLLFIKPLKVILNFNDIETIEDAILKEIFTVAAMVTKSGGTLRVISKNEKFISVVSHKYNNIEVKSYSDIKHLLG